MSGRRYDLVILIGPPGSGKSYLGRLLHDRGIVRFTELEPVLMRRFGVGSAFAARKDEALRFVEETHRAALSEVGPPVAIESTGVSERAVLLGLAKDFAAAFVKLDADRDTCVTRVAGRAEGGNLNNAPESTRQFHDFWTREIAPSYQFDLVIQTEDSDAAVAAIAGLLA